MKRILVDVDGVVADLHSEWLRLYNEDYADNLKPSQITEWDTTKFVKPECGNKIFDYLHNPNLYDSVKPIDGALSSIQWLRQHGYDVRYVTSGVQPAKILWLGEHGFLREDHRFLHSSDVVIANDKSLIKGDIMVDDHIKNLESFDRTRILFAQPWNENSQSYFRADGWPDVIQYLARGLDK